MTTLVQSVSATTWLGPSNYTFTISASGAGNALILSIGTEGFYTGFTISDNQSNTWTLVQFNEEIHGGRSVGIYSCLGAIAGTTTITVTPTGSTGHGGLSGVGAVHEISGGTFALDHTNSANNSATTSIAVTNAAADTTLTDFVVAVIAFGNGNTATGFANPNGTYTTTCVQQNDNTYGAGEICYRINTAALQDTISWTGLQPNPSGGACAIASFKNATPAGAALAGIAVAGINSTAALVNGALLTGTSSLGCVSTAALTTSTITGLELGASASAHAGVSTTNISTVGVNTSNYSGFVVGIITTASQAWQVSNTGIDFSQAAATMDGRLTGTYPITVTDSFNNIYQQYGDVKNYQSGNASASLWICQKGLGGANHSVTVIQTIPSDMAILFQEIQSANGTGVLIDQLSQTVAASSPYATTPVTTAQNQEAILSFFSGYSTSNPANVAISGSGPALAITTSVVNGSVAAPLTGAMAAAIIYSKQTSLTYNWTQTGDAADAALFQLALYAPTAGALAVMPASATIGATGALATGASFAGIAATTTSCSGSILNLASVTLVFLNAYTGIGSIYDPYFWVDDIPVVGDVVSYDPTYITIYPTGEIVSTQNNVSVFVSFVGPDGPAQGTINFTSGLVGVSTNHVYSTASLTTIPSVFGGNAGTYCAATGSLTTGIALGGPTASIVSLQDNGLTTAIQLAAPAVTLTYAFGYLGTPAAFAGSASVTVASTGTVQLTQFLSGTAYILEITSDPTLGSGDLFYGTSGLIARASGALSTSISPVGTARALVTARGALTTGVAIAGNAVSVASGTSAITTSKLMTGVSRTVTAAVASLSIGSGFAALSVSFCKANGAFRTGPGFNGTAIALTSGSGMLTGVMTGGGNGPPPPAPGALLVGTALVLVLVDPELAPTLTTMQSPVGMYVEDPNLIIGQRFSFAQSFLTIGPTEQRIFTFDYTADLAAGENLTGVATFTVENTAGTDPMTGPSIVSGVLSFDTTQTLVLAPINANNGFIENDYYITVTCPTTNPNKTIDRFGLVQIRS